MTQPTRSSQSKRRFSWRKLLIRVGAAVIALELLYLGAANAVLHTGTLKRILNRKPEKLHFTWESATTFLPGLVQVHGFELRSQTRKGQFFLRISRARASISLIKLPFRKVDIHGLKGEEVDLRYRRRLDAPSPTALEDEDAPRPNLQPEFFPEIPGLTNPPDPKPEVLYPIKPTGRWTIALSDVQLKGPISLWLNHIRVFGEGDLGGRLTLKPRREVQIQRSQFHLSAVTVMAGDKTISETLDLSGDLGFDPLPTSGIKPRDWIANMSGQIAIQGRIKGLFPQTQRITPGLTAGGQGWLQTNLTLDHGVVQAGSHYELRSESFHVGIMDLLATGSAEVIADTTAYEGDLLTQAMARFHSYRLVDPQDPSVNVTGEGLELRVQWSNLTLAQALMPIHVALDMPPATLHNLTALNGLLPKQSTLNFTRGTGTLEAHLQVNEERLASGTLAIKAREIQLQRQDQSFSGDLSAFAHLADGDLAARRFQLFDTQIHFEQPVPATSALDNPEEDNWFCHAEMEHGTVIFARPMDSKSQVTLTMRDSQPIMDALKQVDGAPRWLTLIPLIRNITASAGLQTDTSGISIHDLTADADHLHVLGSLHIANKRLNGGMYIQYKRLATGLEFQQGKSTFHLVKPRAWYEAWAREP